MPFLSVGCRLEYELLRGRHAAAAPFVMLHEGLGSVAMWNDFPARLSEETGRSVVVYSRRGHGRSKQLAQARSVRYRHDEALPRRPGRCILGSERCLAPSRFRSWNIETFVSRIRVPFLAIQGLEGEYSTLAQIEGVAARIADVELLKLPTCRHSPHRDQPDAVLQAVARWLTRLK